ncbi:MAG TPA: hypothetical protein V6C78_15680 [Crinalium sp.]|jgi:hypothetical protein
MPRKIDSKCLACSQLSRQEAIQRYGEKGDGCFVPNRCDRRRSHYRHRKDNNARRRGLYAEAKTEFTTATSTVETIAVAPPLVPIALVYLYRDARKDAHLHAIAVSVWQGNQKLAEVPPMHCMGMTNRQVNQYLRQILSTLTEKYKITEFEPEIRLEPLECPIRPCPLREL